MILNILYGVALLILLILSALYSACDMAYSSVNKLRLEKRSFIGDEKATRALSLVNNYDRTIATVLFGNDFVNILASSLASMLGVALFKNLWGEGTATTVSSLILLILLLIFGEITPKAIAKAHNYSLAIHLTTFVKINEVLFFPFVVPADKFAELLSSPLIEKVPAENQLASDEELQAMVRDIEKEGIIDEGQSELLHRSIDFKETSCYEIMTPRVLVFGYDIDTDLAAFLKSPQAFKHSRIPVYRGNLDQILGYIPVKTLLRVLVKGEKPHLEDLLLPIVSVPRTMMISSAMKLMKETHHHIAIVRDEFGGTEGIVTLEDILEELVGEMWDESDRVESDIVESSHNVFLVKGKANIDDVFSRFNLNADHLPDDYTTVSGWVIDRLGRFAKVGDKLSYGKIDVVVTKAGDYTIQEVKITYHPRRRSPV
jgi:putative hemolysin